jgi:hypothetical protein
MTSTALKYLTKSERLFRLLLITMKINLTITLGRVCMRGQIIETE